MCTLERRGQVFVLTLTGGGEHRLGHDLISSLRSALSSVSSAAAASGGSAALLTVADGRFFSNGLDLAWASSASSPSESRARIEILVDLLRPLVADLLALPMPTVAAVTGHAAAAGFLLAISHDYVTMRSDRAVLYMSELDIGLPLPPYFMAILRSKITSARALRDVVLGSKKVAAAEAKEMGIIDKACANAAEAAAEAMKLAEELAAKKWDGSVYRSIRVSMYPEACRAVGLVEESDQEKSKWFASKL